MNVVMLGMTYSRRSLFIQSLIRFAHTDLIWKYNEMCINKTVMLGIVGKGKTGGWTQSEGLTSIYSEEMPSIWLPAHQLEGT